jgi:hypothetical protein
VALSGVTKRVKKLPNLGKVAKTVDKQKKMPKHQILKVQNIKIKPLWNFRIPKTNFALKLLILSENVKKCFREK